MVLLTLACWPTLPERPGADTVIEADADTDADTDSDTDADADADTDADTDLEDADGDGWTARQGDCQDDNPDIHPGANEEWGNPLDEDCDGFAVTFLDDFEGGVHGTPVLEQNGWTCWGTSFCDATYSNHLPRSGSLGVDLNTDGGDIARTAIPTTDFAISWWAYDDGSAGDKHIMRLLAEDDNKWWAGVSPSTCSEGEYCLWQKDSGVFPIAPRRGGWHRFELVMDYDAETLYGCVDGLCSEGRAFTSVFSDVQFIDDGVGLYVDDVMIHALGVDHDGDGVEAHLDCWDTDDASWPGADEVCDGYDNDCDGRVDEGACPDVTDMPEARPRRVLEIGPDVQDGVEVGASLALDGCADAYTLEMWVKADHQGCWEDLLARGGPGDASPYLRVCNETLQALFHTSSGDFEVNATNVLNGGWQFVAVTADNSSLTMWVDGMEVADGEIHGCWVSDNPTWIGGGVSSGAGTGKDGRYGHVRVSSIARYNGPHQPPGDLRTDGWTIAAWTLEGPDAGVQDQSGRVQHGQPGGDLTWPDDRY